MNQKAVLEKLKNLELSTYPDKEVYSLLHQLRMIGVLETTLSAGSYIYKCRPGSGYRTLDELKYPPVEKCEKAQRANLRNNTIFYGVLGDTSNMTTSAEYISMCECSNLLWKEDAQKEKEYLSFGRWSVMRDLRLASIVHESFFRMISNPLLDSIKRDYMRKRLSVKQFDDIQMFICSEFAKPVDRNNDYEYLISAMYSWILTSELGFDGIIYPSVRAEGKVGLNVALCTDTVDKCKIELEKIYEVDVFRHHKKIEVINRRYIDFPSLTTREIVVKEDEIWNKLIN